MRVACSRVVPAPMAGSRLSDQGIWGGEFQLGPGENALVVSPSGRGKTTLLHLLYGIRRDYGGSIFLDHSDIRSLPDAAWLKIRRRSISIVFQDLRLFDNLSARENVEMVRSITGEVPVEAVAEMACEMGIAGQLDTPCAILSSGQRQRVALIRALARPFTLLLLDEPFSHLDEENARIACQIISRRQQETGSSLLVTGLDEKSPLPVERVCVL